MNYATTRLTFQRELMSACWDEALPMFFRHHVEMEHLDHKHFNPDKEIYMSMEDRNTLRFYTARNETELAGYAVFLFFPSLWYKGNLEVSGHSLYFDAAYRKGLAALNFLQFIESQHDLEDPINRHLHSHLGRREYLLIQRLGYHRVHEEWEKPRKESHA